MRQVGKMLRRVIQFNLNVLPKKCVFMNTKMECFGFVAGKDGLKVEPKKFTVLRSGRVQKI